MELDVMMGCAVFSMDWMDASALGMRLRRARYSSVKMMA